MRVPLVDVAIADVSGAALRLFSTPTDHPPVLSRQVAVDGWVVVLDVLAASHRVALFGGQRSGSPLVSETVACVAGLTGSDDPVPVAAADLPARHRWGSGGWVMEFSSHTTRGPRAVANAAEELQQLSSETSLVAQFPGHELARTALQVERHQVGAEVALIWQSWHLYPGRDPHVVVSRTIATPRLCRKGQR